MILFLFNQMKPFITINTVKILFSGFFLNFKILEKEFSFVYVKTFLGTWRMKIKFSIIQICLCIRSQPCTLFQLNMNISSLNNRDIDI